MSTSQALMAAAIGGGGAVLAQTVAGLLAAHRDRTARRRAVVERVEDRLERDHQLFFVEKKAVYAEALDESMTTLQLIHDQVVGPASAVTHGDLRLAVTHLDRHRARLRLFASEEICGEFDLFRLACEMLMVEVRRNPHKLGDSYAAAEVRLDSMADFMTSNLVPRKQAPELEIAE